MKANRSGADVDLFGNAVERTGLASFLAEHDAATFTARLQRLRFVGEVHPEDYGFMPADTALLFTEVRSTFVNGNFVSTILLAQAFVEHRLRGLFETPALRKTGKRGIAAMTDFLREHEALHPYILDQMDTLRKLRNPLMHQAHPGPESVSYRSVEAQLSFEEFLHQQAKRALSLMYTLSVTDFGHLYRLAWPGEETEADNRG